ncbi:MAG: xanthine dehydrogenase family protein molybdopterin-binding subunit, partial [Alphaproteobacteria bacterium]|nr:xanthine dehydrogenase family protein molybdopterin-binding subunit [Alphaproteobacteria bacterium]
MSTAAPAPKQNMGQPVPRLDARLKVTGRARYASDLPVVNAAFAFLVTSPISRGKITIIESGAAKTIPGVIEIFTHENTSELHEVKYAPGGGGVST